MIKALSVNCPNCGAPLVLEDAVDRVACAYCGRDFLLREQSARVATRHDRRAARAYEAQRTGETALPAHLTRSAGRAAPAKGPGRSFLLLGGFLALTALGSGIFIMLRVRAAQREQRELSATRVAKPVKRDTALRRGADAIDIVNKAQHLASTLSGGKALRLYRVELVGFRRGAVGDAFLGGAVEFLPKEGGSRSLYRVRVDKAGALSAKQQKAEGVEVPRRAPARCASKTQWRRAVKAGLSPDRLVDYSLRKERGAWVWVVAPTKGGTASWRYDAMHCDPVEG